MYGKCSNIIFQIYILVSSLYLKDINKSICTINIQSVPARRSEKCKHTVTIQCSYSAPRGRGWPLSSPPDGLAGHLQAVPRSSGSGTHHSTLGLWTGSSLPGQATQCRYLQLSEGQSHPTHDPGFTPGSQAGKMNRNPLFGSEIHCSGLDSLIQKYSGGGRGVPG